MRLRFLLPVLPVLLTAAIAHAQPRGGVVRGKITNGTTGAPGKAERVALIRMESGLEPVATKERVSGSFTLEGITLAGEAPYLLQVTSGGVNYNQPISFGRGYEAEATVTVYDATRDWKDVTISTARVLLRRDHDQLRVDKLYVIENRTEPKKTFFSEEGSFKFTLPPEGELKELLNVSASSGSGMPVSQSAVPLSDGSGYVTKTAFKPGTTELAVSYLVDYSKGSYTYRDKAFYPLPEFLALVSPADVKVDAKGLEPLPEADTKGRFAALRAVNLKAGNPIEISLSGGSDHAPEIAPSGDAEDPHAGGTPQITELPDPTRANKWIIALLMGAALTYGLLTALLPAEAPAAAPPSRGGRASKKK